MRSLIRCFFAAVIAIVLASCQGISPQAQGWATRLPQFEGLPQVTPAQLYNEIGIKQNLLPLGKVGRMGWKMQPQYITIHSTQNFSPGATAWQHARGMQNGAFRAHKRPGGNRTGYLTWHFTMQQDGGVQHLPTREQGEHADFAGPGNRTSIGIEMCENPGNDLAWTVDRTARLAAYLMYVYGLPLDRVVPHYHWPRYGTSPLHKDCPHFLLNNGKPGATWNWFLSRVKMHRSRIVPGPVVPV